LGLLLFSVSTFRPGRASRFFLIKFRAIVTKRTKYLSEESKFGTDLHFVSRENRSSSVNGFEVVRVQVVILCNVRRWWVLVHPLVLWCSR